jgi:hypothetical protein
MTGYSRFRQAFRASGLAACAVGALLYAAAPAQSQNVVRGGRHHGVTTQAPVAADPGQNTDGRANGGSETEAIPERGGRGTLPDRRIGTVSDAPSGRRGAPSATVTRAPFQPAPTAPSGNDNAPVTGGLTPPSGPAGMPIGPIAGTPIGPIAGIPTGPPAGMEPSGWRRPSPVRNTTPVDPPHRRHPGRHDRPGHSTYPDYPTYPSYPTYPTYPNGYYPGGYYGGSTVVVPGGGSTIVISGGTTYLGGYYYGFYTNTGMGDNIYPSVYAMYSGFPQYICPPNIQIIQPVVPQYYTAPAAFRAPPQPVVYKETVYYVDSPKRAADIEAGGVRAKKAINTAFPADSYQAAFSDIERAWNESDLPLLKKHMRDDDSKISVYLDKKYAYTVSSLDFTQITRDAIDRLNTVSFKFDKLRKAKNGVVTAYGRHIYRTSGESDEAPVGETVPFDTTGGEEVGGDDEGGVRKTVYVSYTLRRRGSQWYVISVGTSDKELGEIK